MASLRVPLAALVEGEVLLPDDSAHYVRRVHRLGVGDRFEAFDPEARLEADAEIIAVAKRVRVRLSAVRPGRLLSLRSVTLVQSLAKGVKVDSVVRDATELGATRVVIARAERSVKRGGDARRWQRVAVEAARQCGRGDVPVVEGPRGLAEVLSPALAATELGYCLHPGSDASLGEALAEGLAGNPEAAVTLVIGPEGGLSDLELAAAAASGYRQVSLGPFVLRTETACAAALGAVLAYGRG